MIILIILLAIGGFITHAQAKKFIVWYLVIAGVVIVGAVLYFQQQTAGIAGTAADATDSLTS